jgi:hypothetical protein
MPILLQLVKWKENNNKNSMRKKYIVRWYEYNLTHEKNRRFFTLTCALIYQWYLKYIRGNYSKLYEIWPIE